MSVMTEPRRVHEGRNIKRIREILGIKQDALALELSLSQQAISNIEQRETVDEKILEDIAGVLKVPVEAIKNFDEQATVSFVASTFHDNASIFNSNCSININPLEKWMEAVDKNEKLYERLLQAEKEKVELLERLLKEK